MGRGGGGWGGGWPCASAPGWGREQGRGGGAGHPGAGVPAPACASSPPGRLRHLLAPPWVRRFIRWLTHRHCVSKRLTSCAPEEDPLPLSGFRTVGETRLPSLGLLTPVRISLTTPSPFPEAPWHQPARTSVARLPSGDPWRGREAALCQWAKTFFRGKPQRPLPIVSRTHLCTRGPGRDIKPKRRTGGLQT